MAPIDKRIIKFIGEHHILNLAVARDNQPWCATCYYAYLEEENLFIFTSGDETRHVRDMVEGGNFRVAGTIALETRIVGKIRGLQFSGRMFRPEEGLLKRAKSAYLNEFPIARVIKLHLWALQPDILKMTDNRLGFGTKLTWTHPESSGTKLS
jgi:uncharacterized protein YhbP (UPF0306 family)